MASLPVSNLTLRAYPLCMALLTLATCRRDSPTPSLAVEAGTAESSRANPASSAVPLKVEWAGCAGIRRGPVCELDARRRLTLWLGDSGKAKWPVVADQGRPVVKVDAEIDGGTRMTVDVPAGARRIAIQDPSGQSRWSLTVGEVKAHDEIDKLLVIGRTGKYADALKSLAVLREGAPAVERGPIDAAIGRMALALGDVDRAEPAFRASIAAARTEERASDVVKDGAALLWALVHLRQRYAEARSLLEEMTPFGEQYPEGRVWLDYHAGLLASDTADVRSALEKYRAAQRGAQRLGRDSMEENAADEVARVLTRIGSAEEAVTIARKLPIPTEPCARATRALNLGEALMEQAAHRQSRARDPEVTAALGAARTATEGCPDAHRRLLAAIYTMEYAVAIRDDDEANRLARELDKPQPDRNVLRASRLGDVMGRWLLQQRKPSAALALFENQIPSARAAGLLEETFRGEVGAGRSLLALGRRGAAVVRLKKAQDVLEQMLRGIPIEEGRGSFLGGHDDGVRYLVSALVEGGAVRDALQTARWARSIELRYAARLDRFARLPRDARRRWDEALGRYQIIRSEIEQQSENDWAIPRALLVGVRTERQTRAEQARAALDEAYRLLADNLGSTTGFELSNPAPGELYLVFFPSPDGWLAVAASRAEVVVRRIAGEAFSSEEEAAKVLAPFGPQLAAARRVRLFPYGAANRVDWQSALWKGRPLLASVEVEYALDVGTRTLASPAGSKTAALVVSNPSNDLPAATPEADAVSRALTGWEVSRLDGPAATRAATLQGLAQAGLFHYAGHAQVSGPTGLSSALLLKGDARVELGDLLAAPSVPEVVFLSACEAAGTTDRQASLMGLAQAFIAAGSRVAVAPTRPIRDVETRAFVTAFYAAFVQARAKSVRVTSVETVEYVRRAFRKAALEVGSRDREAGEGFQLLVP